MRESEICVYFFIEVLGESQPKISRHLAFLRNAGIVEARREGKWMHYKIVAPTSDSATMVLQSTLKWLDAQESMRRDYEKLAEMCHPSSLSVEASRAPKPNTFVKKNINKKRTNELEIFLL